MLFILTKTCKTTIYVSIVSFLFFIFCETYKGWGKFTKFNICGDQWHSKQSPITSSSHLGAFMLSSCTFKKLVFLLIFSLRHLWSNKGGGGSFGNCHACSITQAMNFSSLVFFLHIPWPSTLKHMWRYVSGERSSWSYLYILSFSWISNA